MPWAIGVSVIFLVLVPTAQAQELDAPDDVEETSHHLDVSLASGIASVEEHFAFTRVAGRAEIEVRAPLPEHASVVSIRVCHRRHCRRLVDTGDRSSLVAYAFALYTPTRGSSGPIAEATWDASGVVLRLAPVDRAPLTVDLRYAAPLVIHEGRARLVIPASRADTRLTPTEVTVVSAELAEASIGGLGAHATLDASPEIAIEARVAAPIASVHRRGAGAATTTRAFAVAPRVAVPHDVILAVDVSPSMEDVPSGRLEAALRATLAVLPEGSRVRVLRFGAHAEWATPDGALPVWQVPSAISPDEILAVGPGALGSRTLYPPVAQRIDEALRDAASPLVILLGDGWLGDPDFTAVARAGARVVLVDVGDAPFTAEVDAAARSTATLALRVGAGLAGRDGTPMSAVVAEPSSPIALRDRFDLPLDAVSTPSGEPFVLEALDRASMSAFGARVHVTAAPWSVLPRELSSASTALDPRIWGDVAKFEAGGPAPRRIPGGVGGVDDAITGAGSSDRRAMQVPRMRVAPAWIVASPSTHGLRRAIVLALRSRVRGCFAEARHGRPSWWARAELHLVLGHREVLAGSVSGPNVDAALAACIVRGLPDIQVPRSDTIMAVNYPFRAEPVAPIAPMPLDPSIRATLDEITGPFDARAIDAEARALLGQ